jgi:ABC-type multidrug transport system fused ATPase/permease subunit
MLRYYSTAYVSMQRINAFLAEEEVPDWASSLKRPTMTVANDSAGRIGFENATLEWHRSDGNEPNNTKPYGQSSEIGTLIEEMVPDEDIHPRLNLGQPLQGEAEDGIPEPVRVVQMEGEIEAARNPNERNKQQQQRPFKLSNLTVFLPTKKLTLVTGNTGSGKTAFLVGLLGGELLVFNNSCRVKVIFLII